jgi:hypothetical protein
MKTSLLTLFSFLFFTTHTTIAQDRTTVTATNSEISDNLDLRAVASIFGDSSNLEDFEMRLNNPETPISNLDLNNDNQVDYLRVIESVEGRTHIIVIQSVLGRDMFQDIATIEVDRSSNNRVQVQVVGDVYMYGTNYIYEPVYVNTPIIYNTFWVSNYIPYCSTWYWGYYPSYFYGWTPFPLFRYRSHINLCINSFHTYHYVNVRHCHNVYYNHYYGRRGNYCERVQPTRSFNNRNVAFTNRHELDATRNIRTLDNRNTRIVSGVRDQSYAAASPRTNTRNISVSDTRIVAENEGNFGGYESPRSNTLPTPRTETITPRSTTNTNVRSYESPRSNTLPTPRTETITPRSTTNTNVRSYESPRSNTLSTPRTETSTPRSTTNTNVRNYESPRSDVVATPKSETITPRNTRNTNVRNYESPRSNTVATPRTETVTPRSNSNQTGNANNEISTRRNRR